jgi:Mrp family chromosome partitioning ATPase
MTEGLIGAGRGETDVFECIAQSQIDNLSVLPAGKSPVGREPVYEAVTLEEVLDNLKHVFPLIVFDLPPATEFTTCFTLAARLDGVVLVVESGRVDRAVAERAKCRLTETNANLVGVVFNKC